MDDKNPRNNDGTTPLYFAAHSGHLKICRLIFASLDEKNLPDNWGNTPLHAAAFNGHLDVCRAIIETLDNTNPMNNNGKTPFCFAAEQGHLEICKLIDSQMEAKDILLKILSVGSGNLLKNIAFGSSVFFAGILTAAFCVYKMAK